MTIEIVKEAIWLKGLVGDLGLQQELTIVYNSQSVIHFIKNHMFHERTEYVDIIMYFIRNVIAQGAIIVKKIHTIDNPIDMMTQFIHWLSLDITQTQLVLMVFEDPLGVCE